MIASQIRRILGLWHSLTVEVEMILIRHICMGLLFSMFAVAAIGKPNRELPKPVISMKNAAQVIKVDELPRDVQRIVWLPMQRQVAFLSWEKPVEVLDTETFKRVRLIADGEKPVTFAVSVDGNIAAWSENNTKVKLQDLHSGKSFIVETNNPQPGIAFSPDGKLFATGGYGTEAKLWQTVNSELVHVLEPPPLPKQAVKGGLTVVFSPNGKTVAVGNRNSATRLYDVQTGKLLHTLEKRMSYQIKVSPDNQILAATYVDGSIGLWDMSTGSLLRSCQAKADELYTVDWSPSGDVLATAGRNAKITLWDPRTLTPLKELDSPEWVIQVCFSPDGTRLFSSGGSFMKSPDRKVTIWGIAAGK
jgi:WD40 repeat protein